MEYSFCFSFTGGGVLREKAEAPGFEFEFDMANYFLSLLFFFSARIYCLCPFIFDCSILATTVITVLSHRPDS